LPNGLWVAVEPTPGYELMPPVRHWSHQLGRALAMAGSWARRHVAGLLAAVVGFMVVVVRRDIVLDRIATIAFGFVPADNSRRLVMRALKLIEYRARWAGRPRPSGLTLARWYIPVAREAPVEPRAALEGLVRLADWASHAPDRPGSVASMSRDDIRQTCRYAVRAWTLARFRGLLRSRS
jgi:hypothetical protein